METYSLITLFIFCFLSSTIIPISSEAIFLYFLYEKSNSPFIIIFIASSGNSLGSILTYWMGSFANSFFLKNKMDKINKYQFKIEKYGSLTAFLSIVPIIGDILVLAMGFFKTNKLLTHIIIIFTKTLRYYLIYKFQNLL